MAGRRDIQPRKAGNRVERLAPPVGYMLGEDRRAEDVLAVQAELLRSEGIDPAWPGFEEPEAVAGAMGVKPAFVTPPIEIWL
jgi:hypothetical protein